MKLSGKISQVMFRVLLRAYPASFRRKYAPGMTELFQARVERARAKGLGALVALWYSTFFDTLRAASAERGEVMVSFFGTLFDPAGALSDVRGGLRRLARAPGTSFLTILLLAVGIAGNVALFTVVNALMLQGPPGIGDVGRAVEVMGDVPSMGATSLSYPEFVAMRDGADGFSALAAWQSAPMAVVRDGVGRSAMGMWVTDQYFEAMDAEPVRGRGFTPYESEANGGVPVVVVSHRFWEVDLGQDTDAIGRTILLGRVAHTIVGIGPPEFHGHMGPVVVDLWVPLSMNPDFSNRRDLWSTSWVEGVGRLADGVSIEEVSVQANGVFSRVREGREDVTGQKSVVVSSLRSVPANGRGIIGAFLGLLMLFGLLALMVLCANVGGMVLARGMAREREIAVRLALGAGRARVVRQFLVESVMLGAVGAAAGVWLAFTGLDIAQNALIPLLPFPVDLNIGAGLPVLGFAVFVALATVVATGLVPALRLVTDDLVTSLKGDGGRGTSPDTSRLRKLLVGGQMAASTLLLVVAALFVRSLQMAGDIDAGFDATDVYVSAVNLRAEGYGDPDVAYPMLKRLREAVEAVPGVERVSLATDLPMDLSRSTTGVRPEGAQSDDAWTSADHAWVGPGYFSVLGIPIEAGREFMESDTREGDRVTVVNRMMADRVWPGESALGKRLEFWGGLYTVVGVVGGVLNETATDPMRPAIYGNFAQHLEMSVDLVVKTRGFDSALAGQIRNAMLSVDSQLSDTPVRSLAAMTSLGLLPQRIAGGVAGAFGLLTVVLAAVGLYGTIAFEVGRRTREIGVRMALGAGRRGLVGSVLLDTVRLAGPGLVIGMLAAYGVGRLAYTFLLGIPSGDPIAFGGVAVLLTTVVAVASWIPALKASRVHPAEALRHE